VHYIQDFVLDVAKHLFTVWINLVKLLDMFKHPFSKSELVESEAWVAEESQAE